MKSGFCSDLSRENNQIVTYSATFFATNANHFVDTLTIEFGTLLFGCHPRRERVKPVVDRTAIHDWN